LNADRSPATNAVEEAFTIEYRLHAEVRQEFPVEGAGDLEPAHREHDMSHAIDLDRHGSSSVVERQDIMAC
jgi:hypothetical protein